MSQSNRILVIGWRPGFTQRAMKLGLEVLYIQKKEHYKEAQKDLADHIFLIDYWDTELLVSFAKALHTVLPFQHVVSLSEYGLIAQAHVNDALGLSSNSVETAELLKDKWKMRQHLNRLGVSSVAARVGQSADEIEAFVEEHGLPAIVKPVDGAGSLGIFRLDSREQIAATYEQIREKKIETFIIEEYLEGPEFSVEAVSHKGRHAVIAITEKLTLPNYVEIGHAVPAQLKSQEEDEIERTVIEFLDAVNLVEGPSHTEVKLTPKGVKVIEGHNRIGGDKINDLVRLATGVDMLTLTAGVPFGLVELPESRPVPVGGSAIRYMTPEPGILREVSGLEEAQQQEYVFSASVDVKIGQPVKTVAESADRAGFVVAKGDTVQEAIARCEDVMNSVKIVTEAQEQEEAVC